ncbi:MAG: Spo0B domain-containing protein [Nocardioides sp.]|nr:Spo0B domain-containing protein [Nocardioides sp.]
MTLARQFLLLQVLIVLAVLVAVGAISIAQSARSFERSEVRPALNAAENLASRAVVRQGIKQGGQPSTLAAAAESVRTVSGSTSALLAGADRVVLVSSDPSQVDHDVDLGPSRVLDGVAWTGVRHEAGHTVVVAQTPVYDSHGHVIGLAAIGRNVPSVWSRLGELAPNLLVYLGVASVLGLGGSLLLSRRVKRQTLGMEPTEIVGLVEHREALVHGVKEGVVALDQASRVTLVNDSARQLLQLPGDCVGRRLDDLDLGPQVVEVLSGAQSGPDRLVLVGDRVLAFNRRPMRSHGSVIGSVTTLRDRTELSALERELGSSRATFDTLRAQTHEFANQLHTISGLLHLEEYDEVVRFVDGVRMSRTALYDEVTSRIADATVAALLIAKASLASERGVELRLLPESHVGKVYGALSRDLTTVVGNLVDNALDAAATTAGPAPALVEVLVLERDGTVVVTVRDSGPGVPDTEQVFRQGWSTKTSPDDGDRGFGLALTRLVCRRRGGDVTVRNEGGAVFTAVLPMSAHDQLKEVSA